MNILDSIYACGIVPVVKLSRAEDAVPLADALSAGGIDVMEVTYRTSSASSVISSISSSRPEIAVGAGTVLSVSQADEAIAAGARFIVSPGFNPSVVSHCISKNIPVIPGCSTCSDMERAIEAGLSVVKFFPSEALGGLEVIKAVSSPYSSLRFMPTGGVDLFNLSAYLSYPKIYACGGSFMVKEELFAGGCFESVVSLSREAVRRVHGFNVKHVGINCGNEAEAKKVCDMLSRFFLLPYDFVKGGTFVGGKFEVMHTPYLGKNGHIAISCNSVPRAYAFFRKQGVEFNEQTASYDASGALKVIYFKDEIGGFAFHLVNI